MGDPAWRDTSWIAVGDRVVYLHVPEGERHVGQGRPGGKTAWLRGGAKGTVVERPKGGYPAHPCPDHGAAEDECVCGNGDGIIDASPTYAVVEWELDDGTTWRRCLFRDDEGIDWRREVRLTPKARALLHLLSRQDFLDGWLPLTKPREVAASRELEAHGIVERQHKGIFGLCARILREEPKEPEAHQVAPGVRRRRGSHG